MVLVVVVFVVTKVVDTVVVLVVIIYLVAVQNVVKVKLHQSPGGVCPPCPLLKITYG